MNKPSRTVPAWWTVPDAIKLILRGVTFHIASQIGRAHV